MKTAIAILVVASVAGMAAADERKTVTLDGEYQWKQGGSDVLTAQFEPAGDQGWHVTFRFEWNGGKYDWKGEATGSLTDGGALTGTVESADGRRTWTFEASVREGFVSATHTETTGGRRYETGTFRLKL